MLSPPRTKWSSSSWRKTPPRPRSPFLSSIHFIGRIAGNHSFLRSPRRRRGCEREGRHGCTPSSKANPGASGVGEQQRQHDRRDRRPFRSVRDAARPLHDGVLRQLHAYERQQLHVQDSVGFFCVFHRSYKTISCIYMFEQPDLAHRALVFCLTRPLRQGQQTYPHLVLYAPTERYSLSLSLSEVRFVPLFDRRTC